MYSVSSLVCEMNTLRIGKDFDFSKYIIIEHKINDNISSERRGFVGTH